MAVGKTRRGRHAHQVPKRRATKPQNSRFKLHAGLASTAVALSAVIAVTAVSAVNSTSLLQVDAQQFTAPQSTLTGLGTVGQGENQTASEEEVVIMAAAELLTVSHTVSETPEVVLAREELADLVDQFSQPAGLDQAAELPEGVDLTERTKAASRDQTRSALDEPAETASEVAPEETDAPDQELETAADLSEEDPTQATAPVGTVTLAEIEQATLALELLLEPEQLGTVASAEDVKDQELVNAWQQAVTLTASTSNYSNGRIPLSAMSELTFAPGHYVRADGAMMMELLNEEFKSVFGHDIAMTDSYRSYSLQVITKAKKGYLAATPGRSNHGLGLALDLRGDVAHWGTVERNWLVKNGATYGWISPAWAQPGVGKEEPWHWEFAGSSVTNIVLPQESPKLDD